MATEAISQAVHNLQVADALAQHGWYPDAFAKVLAAAEESVRAFVYFAVSIGTATFLTNQADGPPYINEADLFRHRKKFAFFAGLEITIGMLIVAITLIRKGPAEVERWRREVDSADTDEASERVLSKYLPTMLPLIEGVPFWEKARQAANYAGANSRGERTYPATREEYEFVRPIVGHRVDTIQRGIETPIPAEELAELREIAARTRNA